MYDQHERYRGVDELGAPMPENGRKGHPMLRAVAGAAAMFGTILVVGPWAHAEVGHLMHPHPAHAPQHPGGVEQQQHQGVDSLPQHP